MSERQLRQGDVRAVVSEPSRLDQFLARQWPAFDRVAVQELIAAGAVTINDQAALKPGQYLETGDVVALARLPEPRVPQLDPLASLSVKYEDDAVLVVDKPAGMATHPGRTHKVNTLAQHLAQRFPALAHVGGVERAGILQHMSPEISGLILVARSEDAYRWLKREVKRQRVGLRYSVLAAGKLTGEGVIAAPIGNAKHKRSLLVVAREGRAAQTFYRALHHYREGNQTFSLLEVRPESARLDQIRVHLSWYGYPVVGDSVYGLTRQPEWADRLFLHLSVLEFPHPDTEAMIHVESELPPALRSVLTYMSHPRQ